MNIELFQMNANVLLCLLLVLIGTGMLTRLPDILNI